MTMLELLVEMKADVNTPQFWEACAEFCRIQAERERAKQSHQDTDGKQ